MPIKKKLIKFIPLDVTTNAVFSGLSH